MRKEKDIERDACNTNERRETTVCHESFKEFLCLYDCCNSLHTDNNNNIIKQHMPF